MMGRRMVAFLVSILLAAGLFAGCGARPAVKRDVGKDVVFTDALGKEISVRNPQRVVALMGSFAETWLLAGGELAGVTDDAFEERGLALPESVPSVGKYNSPNVEKTMALNPDMVILSAQTQAHVALQKVFANAGIPTAYFSVTDFDDYLQMLRICTRITGQEELYQKNGVEVGKQIEQTVSAVQGRKHPSALFLITYSGGAVAMDSKSMTGKMLSDLGCENLADQNPSLLKEFSVESILVSDPDFIFVVPMGNDSEIAKKNLREVIETNPAWSGLSAVKNDRYILLPKEQFLYKPNAKWGESYAYLSKVLYGGK